MGGEQIEIIKPTQEEIIARLIEIGTAPIPKEPSMVWVVEDPLPFRNELDQICTATSVACLNKFPSGEYHLIRSNVACYPYEDKEAAVEDALNRLARAGLRCRLCLGVAHTATGCQYTPTFLVCGTCIQPYIDAMDRLPKSGLPGWLQSWTAAKSSKKLKARFPDAMGFYESAALFLGQDKRNIR